jgi:hypothetical protein
VNSLLNYKWLSKKPFLFQSITGLEVAEFDSFCTQANAKYRDYEAKRLDRPNRKQSGRRVPLQDVSTRQTAHAHGLLQVYITSTLTGVFFDLDQSNVLKDIRNLEPLVCNVLPLPKKQDEKVRRLQSVEEIEAMFPGFKAFLDATEQEIPRPKNKHKRRTHYSGKKKRHAVKTQLTVNQDGLIVHKTRHAVGSTHDYTLYKHSHPDLPDNVRLGLDLGYKGIEKDYPELNCVLLFKRKNPGRGKRGMKGPELSSEQKAFNKELAIERVVVEHTNSRVKKFLIWGGEFRNRPKRYDVITDIVSGLINFRILGALTI